MLIRARFENILSFRHEVEFSMVASAERIHPDHVSRPRGRSDLGLLRCAAIYGANGAGKSNFVKALRFAIDFITKGLPADVPIPVQRFRLDPDCQSAPSKVSIEFRTAGKMYEYGFELTHRQILREWLSRYTLYSESVQFQRETDADGATHISFGRFFEKLPVDERNFLQFVGKGTRPNQLFLRECIDRNVDRFREPYQWFKDTLTIIEPSSRYNPLEVRINKDKEFQEFFGRVLSSADTGIASVTTEEIDIESLDLPDSVYRTVQEILSKGSSAYISTPTGARFGFVKEGDNVRILKLTTYHHAAGLGTGAAFEIYEESDGTQRLIDLIPALYDLVSGNGSRVFVVDEIDRSLHPMLARMIVRSHLEAHKDARESQLIFTTHETALLDLNLLRRDEIWFVEKGPHGGTDLYSLSEFQPRYDKDIRKDYLLGRYGAIPFIGDVRRLGISERAIADHNWARSIGE